MLTSDEVNHAMQSKRIFTLLRIGGLTLGFAVVVVVLLMWLAGSFTPKTGTDAVRDAAERRLAADARVAAATVRRIPRIETAVGTIRAVHETSVASKLLAKVLEVRVAAGQRVTRGEEVLRLDDEELRARLEQAEAAVRSAQAEEEHARLVLDQLQQARDAGAASRIELDRARTDLDAAHAEVERAGQARQEAATVLGYATITSPIDGTVIEKFVEAGDTVVPGQVVVKLFDPTRMQLVARVRESLAQRLAVDEGIGVQVDAIGKICTGIVSEIVPEAESASRAFTVKVTGPCPAGVYSGMFGRLLIPLDEEDVLLVPRSAVRRVGQLEIVDVADGDLLRRRAVETGRVFGDDVEILSGLRAGERVVLHDETRPDFAGS